MSFRQCSAASRLPAPVRRLRLVIFSVIAALAVVAAGAVPVAAAPAPSGASRIGSAAGHSDHPRHAVPALGSTTRPATPSAAAGRHRPVPAGFSDQAKADAARAAAGYRSPGQKPVIQPGGAQTQTASPASASGPTAAALTTGFSNFRGIPDDGIAPPDPTIAAGPANVVLAVNNEIDVYSKVGTQLSHKTFADFFSAEGQPAQDDLFDPWLVYDPYLGRFWFAVASESNNPHRSNVLLGLSDTSDAAGTWATFTLDTELNGDSDSGLWCDYEKLGFDTQAIYLTCNMQSFPTGQDHFQYAKIRVMTKAQFLPPAATCCPSWWDFWNLGEGFLGLSTSRTIQPARMYGAADSDGEYLVDSHSGGGSDDQLEVWHVTNPGNCCTNDPHAPDLSQNGRPVGSFDPPPPARQKGTSATLDIGNDANAGTTLRYAFWQGGHLSTGQDLACPSANAACVAFTEVNVSSFPDMSVVNDWVMTQDSSIDRFYPAVDVNSAGDKTMVYSVSGPNQFAGVAFTHIPPSSSCTSCTDNERTIADGLGPYGSGSDRQRWGDYSGASADPDGVGVWVYGEFAGLNGNWGTEAALTMDRTPTSITYTGPTGADSQATVALSANLVSYGPANPVPLAGGLVTFFLGTQVCNATTDANGRATCSVTLNQPDGTVQVEAEFPGDPDHVPSQTTRDFLIGQGGRTATTLKYTGDTSGEYGNTSSPATLSAVLTAGSPAVPLPLETIDFTLGSQSCTAQTDAGGRASCQLVLQQKPGVYTVTASFPGTAIYAPTLVTVPFTINKAATTTAITSSKNPSDFGQSVTFTATVSRFNQGIGIPSGSVTFRRGAITLGTGVLDATGKTSWTVPILQVGANAISATFGGDDFFLGSKGSLTQTVTCSRTITGTVNNGLDLTSGSTCINGATIRGPLTVEANVPVSITNSKLGNGLFTVGPLALTICGADVNGGVFVESSAKYVLLGDAGDDDAPACAASNYSGSVFLTGNMGQVEVGGNQFKGPLEIDSTTGVGPDEESTRPEIEANTIGGGLACTGNIPVPTNDGHPNVFHNSQASGDCVGL